MNKVFGANYAAVLINKKEKKLKIVWKGFLTGVQFKLVLELVLEQVNKYAIEIIAEDRSKLRLQNQEDFDTWMSSYFLPKLASIRRYLIKDYPSNDLKNLLYSNINNSSKYFVFSNHKEFDSTFEAK